MKKMKTIIAATIIMASFTGVAMAADSSIQTINKGPVETYLDCVIDCVSRTDMNTYRRIACASDCYLQFVSDLINLFK